jgi:hypothetical protein
MTIPQVVRWNSSATRTKQSGSDEKLTCGNRKTPLLDPKTAPDGPWSLPIHTPACPSANAKTTPNPTSQMHDLRPGIQRNSSGVGWRLKWLDPRTIGCGCIRVYGFDSRTRLDDRSSCKGPLRWPLGLLIGCGLGWMCWARQSGR